MTERQFKKIMQADEILTLLYFEMKEENNKNTREMRLLDKVLGCIHQLKNPDLFPDDSDAE